MNTVPHIMEYLWVFIGSMGGGGWKMVNDTTEASDGQEHKGP